MRRLREREGGFSYVDVLIAIAILMVGILTLGAALTTALVRANQSEDYLRAKGIAASTLENVMSARGVAIDGTTYGFDAIQNVSETGPGVFVVGRKAALSSPGPDGLFGTADDTGDRLGSYEREIVVADVDNPKRPVADGNPVTERRIEITIYFTVQGREDHVTLATNVARY
jgi:hypothetical protein